MGKELVTNWGGYPKIEAEVIEPLDFNLLANNVNQVPIIARGNGRCYGDSSLQNNIISTLKLNKIIFFDDEKGIIKCESGVLLSEILSIIVPKGFFLPVTPGTKWITIGGAVASNVHGKNHHKEGAFSDYIESLDVLTESNEIVNCSKKDNINLFKKTIGGMGFTGVITTITIRLKPIETSYIQQKSLKAKNLDEILNYFELYNDYTYSVAWIDCLAKGKSMGRSILMLGEHLMSENKNDSKEILKLHTSNQTNIPFYFPSFTLNKLTVSAFNFLFYHKQFKKQHDQVIHYDSFFYPLDKLKNWNRIYGKKGFTQYQFVIPFKNGREGLHRILKEITDYGEASFLAVLKSFGKKSQYASELSFPEEGYTLALDFKINKRVFTLLEKLDKIVLEYNGKVYLTKDSRMSKATFNKMYPNFNLNSKFVSKQYERFS